MLAASVANYSYLMSAEEALLGEERYCGLPRGQQSELEAVFPVEKARNYLAGCETISDSQQQRPQAMVVVVARVQSVLALPI